MAEYEDSMKEIEETMGLVLDQFKAIPKDAVAPEWDEMKKYSFSESKIPAKYRELIGLAIAASIKCPYCAYFHTQAAKMNGATDEEIAELALLTRFTTGWSSILHASSIDLDEFKEQFDQAAKHMQSRSR
jgi:AhpD family alkylhydroperoxidase